RWTKGSLPPPPTSPDRADLRLRRETGLAGLTGRHAPQHLLQQNLPAPAYAVVVPFPGPGEHPDRVAVAAGFLRGPVHESPDVCVRRQSPSALFPAQTDHAGSVAVKIQSDAVGVRRDPALQPGSADRHGAEFVAFPARIFRLPVLSGPY